MTVTCHRGVSYSSAVNDQGYNRRRIDQGENQTPVKRRNITDDTLHAISNDRALQGKYQRNDGAVSPFVGGNKHTRRVFSTMQQTYKRRIGSPAIRGQLHCLFTRGHKHTGYSRIGQGHRRRIAFCNQLDTHGESDKQDRPQAKATDRGGSKYHRRDDRALQGKYQALKAKKKAIR